MSLLRRDKDEDVSVLADFPSVDDVPSQSPSIVSASRYAIAQEKREKKVNSRFIGSPWMPEGKSKRKRTRTSQFFRRVDGGQYAHVLVLDPMALNNLTDVGVFYAWYHKHVSAYKA